MISRDNLSLGLAISCIAVVLCIAPALLGCKKYRDDLDYSYDVVQTWELTDTFVPGDVVQFESVFWEPDDTVSLREAIADDAICNGRSVLEIGTGTGLLSVLAATHSAKKIVATDINPAAVANAKYNLAMLAEDFKDAEVRLVKKDDSGAFAVVKPTEKFDLIISNPPWEDGKVTKPSEYAFYDPDFALMDSLLDGLPKHLNPAGRCLLAYGHAPALKRVRDEVAKRGYSFKVLDDRKIDELEENFLPGMMVEIRVPYNQTKIGAKPKEDAKPKKETERKESTASKDGTPVKETHTQSE